MNTNFSLICLIIMLAFSLLNDLLAIFNENYLNNINSECKDDFKRFIIKEYIIRFIIDICCIITFLKFLT